MKNHPNRPRCALAPLRLREVLSVVAFHLLASGIASFFASAAPLNFALRADEVKDERQEQADRRYHWSSALLRLGARSFQGQTANHSNGKSACRNRHQTF